jgi:hypothetical protein
MQCWLVIRVCRACCLHVVHAYCSRRCRDVRVHRLAIRACCAWCRVVHASFAHVARAVSRVARYPRAIFNRSLIITHVI